MTQKTAEKLNALLTKASKGPPIRVAIVQPTLEVVIEGAVEAYKKNLIEPVFIGPMQRVAKIAHKAKINLDKFECIDVPHSHAAGAKAVEMANAGKVFTLMKGGQHTDEFLLAILDSTTGLRTDKRMSHCFVIDVPDQKKLFLLTDAAINMAPTLVEKVDIVQNAINFGIALGIKIPKVALLAAVEVINPKMQATLDAAALCKMADRKQITGAIIDGPLAYDNAISAQAAKMKGIDSRVAGHPDILVVPNLESGNMLAKQLIYLADARVAGIVLGAKVPIILTSRSDNVYGRVMSCALAKLYAAYLFALTKN
jgi:phosphate acetyltransferase